MSRFTTVLPRFLCLSFFTLSLGITGTRALPAGEPPLTGKLPQDCVAYLGWGGWQTTAEARAKTGLGELMNQPGMTRLLAEADKWLNSTGADKALEKVPEPLRPAIKTVIQTAWLRPWALSATKVDPAMPAGTPVEGVLVIDLGAQADEFTKAFNTLLAMCPMPMEDIDFQYLNGQEPAVAKIKLIKGGEGGSPEAIAGVAGQHFVLALGSSAVKSLKGVFLGQNKTLAANPAFSAAAAKSCPGTSVLQVYADTTQLMPLAMMAAAGDPKIGPVINVLGLDSLKSVSLGVSYTGRNLTTAVYFAGPPAGLSSLVDPEPVANDLLKFVPADAGMMVAFNLDRAGVVAKIKALLDKNQPGASGKVDLFFEKFKLVSEIDIPADVFPLLGKGVVLFDAPSSGGFVFGWQVAVECKSEADAAKLTGLFKKYVGAINVFLQKNQTDSNLEVTEAVVSGHKLNVVNIASKVTPLPLAISWGQAGKVLILGLYPQPVADTLARVNPLEGASKTNILANPQFATLHKGASTTGSLLYYGDATGMAKFLYPFGLAASSAGITYLRGAGVKVSVADLPTQLQVLSALGAGIGSLTTDQEGTLFTMTSPVGVTVPLLSGEEGVMGTTMVFISAVTFLGKKVEAKFERVQPNLDESDASVPVQFNRLRTAPLKERNLLNQPDIEQPAPANRDLGGAEVQPSKTLTVAHVEAIRDVLTAYAAEHQGAFPADKNALLAVDGASSSPRLTGAAWSGPDFDGAFAYMAKLKSSDPGNLVLGYSKQKNDRSQRLVLYLNGQIRLCTVEQLKTALERTQKFLTEQGR